MPRCICALAEEAIGAMRTPEDYIRDPDSLPAGDAARWFILHGIRQQVRDERLRGLSPDMINRFLRALPDEHQLTLLADLVDRWGALGADDAMFDVLKKVARI